MRKYVLRFLQFNFVFFILVGVGMTILNGCVLSKYVYSEKEIKEHYSKKDFSPRFATASYKGRSIHYAQTGVDTMPTMLFIHGGPGAWYGWMDFLDDDSLRRKFNLVAVDRLGYGKSDYGKPELSTQEQANAIKEVLAKFPAGKKIILVGRSYGAPIAALIARDLGERIERMILISPVVTPDKEKFYWFSSLGNSKIINWMLPKMFNVATAEKYGHAKEMKNIIGEWEKISCPSVIISGAKDWVADTSNFKMTDTLLKNSCDKKVYWLQDAGHFISYEKKDFVKEILIESSAKNDNYFSGKLESPPPAK